jgi:peptidoglycan hydrolase-like protein with peptidoglycan-binding domain
MRKVPDGGSRKLSPVSIFAIAATTVFSLAITGNALLGQGGGHQSFASATGEAIIPDGATTRLQVDAPAGGGTTIQLKYDPLVEGVQRQLQASGYYKGAVDGVLGKKTRSAIQAYQKAAGIDPTGEPTQDLVEHIRYTREVLEAALFTGSVDVAADADARADVRRVQTGLADLAYSPGEINGELTAKTRKAIMAFQHDRNLPQTGEISDALLGELAKMSGQSEVTVE